MTTPYSPICDFCHTALPERTGFVSFWFSHERFCTVACLDAKEEDRRIEWHKRDNPYIITRYGNRNWAVYDSGGELVVVALYKKGAAEVVRRLTSKR